MNFGHADLFAGLGRKLKYSVFLRAVTGNKQSPVVRLPFCRQWVVKLKPRPRDKTFSQHPIFQFPTVSTLKPSSCSRTP